MNKTLINNIKSSLFNAVSGTTTTDVYFLVLPNEEIIKRFNVIYELNTKDITHTFDQKEVVMDYELIIYVNNPKYEPILDAVVFIKKQVYDLMKVNSSVKSVNLTDQELTYNFDLSVYTGRLNFDVQYTS